MNAQQAVPGPSDGGATRRDRMPPLSNDHMNDAQKKAAAILTAGPRGGVKGPFIPLLRSPELMDRLQKVGEYLRFQSCLETRINEFVMLVTARQVTNQFEWAVHHPLAITAGLDQAKIDTLAEGRRPGAMAEDEEIAYDLSTEVMRTNSASETTYRRAIERFGERGVVEMVTLVGYFATVSWLMNVAHTPPPADSSVPVLETFPL